MVLRRSNKKGKTSGGFNGPRYAGSFPLCQGTPLGGPLRRILFKLVVQRLQADAENLGPPGFLLVASGFQRFKKSAFFRLLPP